ncbi:MAG TPA: Gfo/Idh/MocA family oxidoreductase [Casimicrobiaceae bacterium]|nr:Gfo/Idh/MocA family oxidoreductase [Casimicrobiaceae bacterium]
MAAKQRIGVVGAGFVSFHHLVAWHAIDSATVVAIADVDRRKVWARAREFGIDAMYESAEAMLDEARLDAIDIASPVETHAHCCAVVVEGNPATPGFPPTPADDLDVVGPSTRIQLQGARLERSGARAETVHLDLGADYQSAFTHAAEHFATCIATDKPFESDAADNLRTLALVDAAYRCAEDRR